MFKKTSKRMNTKLVEKSQKKTIESAFLSTCTYEAYVYYILDLYKKCLD